MRAISAESMPTISASNSAFTCSTGTPSCSLRMIDLSASWRCAATSGSTGAAGAFAASSAAISWVAISVRMSSRSLSASTFAIDAAVSILATRAIVLNSAGFLSAEKCEL